MEAVGIEFLLAPELEWKVPSQSLQCFEHSKLDHLVIDLPKAAQMISTSLRRLLLQIHGDNIATIKVAVEPLFHDFSGFRAVRLR